MSQKNKAHIKKVDNKVRKNDVQFKALKINGLESKVRSF